MIHAYTYATTKDTGNIALQMALYVIAMHVNVETGKTFAGIRTLMAEAKVKSDRTMRNYIAKLEAKGFIKREKRTRPNGANTSDLIELCGFREWFLAQRGVADPAAKNTGGSQTDGGSNPPAPKRQKLPGGSGSSGLPGGTGKQATAPVNSQSLTKSIKPDRKCVAEEETKGTDKVLAEGAPSHAPLFGSDQTEFMAEVRPAKCKGMVFDTSDEHLVSEADRKTIEALGGDVEELFDRAIAQKAKGRRIGNLVRYMIQSAKNDARTRLGVGMGVVTAVASGHQWARQAAYGAIGEAARPRKSIADVRASPELVRTELARKSNPS